MARFAVLLGLVGCYSPAYKDCEVSCELGKGCPSGLTCEQDRCRVSGHGDQCGSMAEAGADDALDAPSDAGAGGVAVIAASGDHTCAACMNGSVWCWGSNGSHESSGAVVDDSCMCNPHPTRVQNGVFTNATELGLGKHHSCLGYSAVHKLACWGSNTGGQLAIGTVIDKDQPVDLGTNGSAIVGGDAHTCYISNQNVFCAGVNTNGAVGDGTVAQRLVPTPNGAQHATGIAAGMEHSCAITNDTATCWGNNAFLQVSGSATQPSAQVLSPIPVSIVGKVNQLALGDEFSCALTSVHDVSCWGNNQKGQFGNLLTPAPPQEAQVVQSGIQLIAAGGNQLCMLDLQNTLRCSGEQQAGVFQEPLLIALPPGALPTAIAVGRKHGCALLADHSLYCWGANDSGQLGNGGHDAGSMAPGKVDVCQ